MKKTLALILLVQTLSVSAQTPNYWQQSVDYTIDVDFYDTENGKFNGVQKVVYTNNSPDTLSRVFFHLYFNAFQPGSMMDVRSRTLPDPDRRVGERIAHLEAEEQGFHKFSLIQQDGKNVTYSINQTVMEVKLAKVILPNTKTTFTLNYSSQVPKQVRRSGKNNAEGIDFSMTQWYPKLAEYDFEGWHPTPYVAREFHGVWGDFNVNISIDSKYTLGGTGEVQNAQEVGHGYGEKDPSSYPEKLTWKFKANMVHDFAWAADPDYKHTKIKGGNTTFHFLYKPDKTYSAAWEVLPQKTVDIFEFMSKTFGEYPYPVYSVIQGGDGGMEYPMATLITGDRKESSLIGVTAHEAIHSWYQGVLATNESKYGWMDEGFTNFASAETVNAINDDKKDNPHLGSYSGYFRLQSSGKQEPLTTHADHYNTNFAYGTASYTMGQLFLAQLKYIVGEEVFYKGMKRYFNTWKHKHPTPNGFLRVMEKESGMVLDWYLNYWTTQTKAIDYGVKSVTGKKETEITLERIGEMPMPVELEVELKDGSIKTYYIPLNIMWGSKKVEAKNLSPWPWTHPSYSFTVNVPFKDIERVIIFPTDEVADIEKGNNSFSSSTISTTFKGSTTK